ncbi:helix-turn-helix transcriptional regulator [Saccharothrix sp. S26]|uniref:winged helix-turn-helix transcriptional regulator n=1 Tax=Saccharothrix sp. S26 TaxID=2907215 RepID=UPI001F1E2FA9|nr:helix-turn-helix domain-containing protein [Saccharothrix sp. S26]MCE6997546.1 helix-turn-helix transcriptional regulator [Saccharothrix sp. S26]
MSDYDVFLSDCPARTTLEVVGHTWSVVVVVALGDGPLRYGELLDRIGGISNKMLTQTLARLRANGLLTSVDGRHALTALGRSLLTPVRALAAWAEEHTGDLLDARRDASVRAANRPPGPEPDPHKTDPGTDRRPDRRPDPRPDPRAASRDGRPGSDIRPPAVGSSAAG